MDWTEVENSTNIASYSYENQTKTLHVRFKSGGEGSYADVPEEVYDKFLEAESKGKFLNSDIKPHYAWAKQEKKEDEEE